MATSSQHEDFIQYEDTKQEDFYDFDAEQQSVKQQHFSQERFMGATPDIQGMKSTIQQLKNQLRELQIQLQQEVNTSKRLRYQRDQHRSTAEELANQVAKLQPEEEEMYDSDEEEQEPVEKKVTVLLRRTKKNLHSQQSQYPSTSNNGLQARYQPVSQQFDTKTGLMTSQGQGFAPVSQGSNKHYPDVPEFHGDPTVWESWQLHLHSKFRASAILFPTEQSRIDYIRDHCKSTAFDVIKARCLRDASDPYTTAQQMLEDLDNMYGEFDPYGTADARLHSPDFGMSVQKKETFDQFLTRYTVTIAPLQLSEQQKISQLTRTITRRLRFLTINGIKPTVFKDYVKRLRQCDLNMRLTNQQHGHQHDQYHEDFDGYSSDQSHSSKSSKQGKGRGYHGANQHSKETREQLRHEGKCFRCQKPGHMAMDQNAPCKGRSNSRERAVEKD